MLVLAAVILVGAAAAWYFTGQDGGGSGGGTGGEGGGKAAKSTKPSKVTVAVFNGTGGAEAGLAAEYSGFLEEKGFRLGATADAPETFDETIVYYENGSKAGAELVAEEIDAESVELVPSEISQLAPSADVIAVIGLNHSDLPASGA